MSASVPWRTPYAGLEGRRRFGFVAGRLIKDGKIQRSQIGIQAQDVPLLPQVKRFHRIDARSGVLVVRVTGGAPAARGVSATATSSSDSRASRSRGSPTSIAFSRTSGSADR
jgi:S1-C subfamily serine protease